MSVVSVRFASHSSAGIKPNNDDALAVKIAHGSELLHKGISAVIADGASCCSGAEIASRTAVTDFINNYYSTPDSWSVEKSATRVLSALNNWLFAQGQRAFNSEDSLVTTLSACIIKNRTAHIFHVGDSRIYLYRDQQLSQLTEDHCHYQRQTKQYLIRALGIDSKLQIDFKSLPLQPEDKLLLTTDGVHDTLSTAELAQQLAANSGDLQACCDHIASLASAQQSDDNISCLLLEVTSLPSQSIDEAQLALSAKVIPPVMCPGNQIDEYKITKVLHSSTRSHVYLVETADEMQWVLKAPSANFADDPQYLEGFIREAWVGQQINHQHVMRCKPASSESPFRYHLCEYIDGITLRQWMYDHPQPDMAAVRPIIKQVISGIRALQRHQMVHRDLKPENIMLGSDGSVKLVDFGTVQVAGLDEISPFDLEQCPVGSVDYIAPEYLMSQKGTFRSDLFSLAVIVYEMLSGELPYKLRDPKLHPPRSLNAWRYIPLNQRKHPRPLWIDLAIKKACAPNPLHRQQALSEFLTDIQQPNRELLSKFEQAPLIERNPLTFWQVVAVLLLLLNLAQLYWAHH